MYTIVLGVIVALLNRYNKKQPSQKRNHNVPAYQNQEKIGVNHLFYPI